MNNLNEPNKLIKEKSPYLLQHLYNPVNWYPWSEEAFEKAKKEDKPIFLSIGYSTCHWCHVMAHESFEDLEVSGYLNEKFISIKVDREERPDVDSVYMNVCQALNGNGGWPLSVFIDYNKKPIYAGTYFPKTNLLNLLDRISHLWIHDRELLMNQAEQIVEHITYENRQMGNVDIAVAHNAFMQLQNNYDEKYGGFSNAPKFPLPHNLIFLKKYYLCTKNVDALRMMRETLNHMRSGGIFDHIGFGFSRYSVDRKWLVPHFEKMLYDNSLLIISYIEAYKTTKEERFLKTVQEIIEYLLRIMKNKNGGFFTAEDADSEGEEGLFYTFTKNEVMNILGNEGEMFCRYFDITEKGNFEGRNIPNLIGKHIPEYDLEKIENCRKKLFSYQQNRHRPGKDDKILTSYNGLIIAGLSIAGRIIGNQHYIKVAKETVKFIKENLYKDGKLLARYRDKEAKYLGYAEDYAYLIYGLIEIYQTTFEEEYLSFAKDLNNILLKYFYDEEKGGFFLNDRESETIIYRQKEIYDGATPSANSVIINNLYRLSHLLHNHKLFDIANKTLEYFINDMKRYPAGYTFNAINILYKSYYSTDITLSAFNRESLLEIIASINDLDLPFINISIVNNDSYPLVDGKPTAYICKGQRCYSPINDLDLLLTELKNN